MRRHFFVSCVLGYWRYVRREHWIVGSRVSQLRETGRGSGWTRGGRAGSEESKEGEGRVNAVCFIWCRLCDAPPQFRIGSMATPVAPLNLIVIFIPLPLFPSVPHSYQSDNAPNPESHNNSAHGGLVGGPPSLSGCETNEATIIDTGKEYNFRT